MTASALRSSYVGAMDQHAERLFRRALEAAARALRDLKAGQVPAELRRVAGRPLPLPPPLAASLLKGIDRYDWLREKAVQAWPEADAETPGPDLASALLLLRPPGWAARVAVLATGVGAEQGSAEVEDLKASLQAARAEGAEWKRRARAAEQEGRRQARETRRLLEEERAARQAAHPGPAREKAVKTGELARLSALVEVGSAERETLLGENRRLKQGLAKERRARAAAEALLAEGSGSGSWSGDPLALATQLDRIAVMARPPAPKPATTGRGRGGARMRLPARILPDRKEAVDWLARRTGAGTLIVDGYNLAFVLTGSREPAVGREAVLMVLERLRRVARGPLRIVVAFDSRFEAGAAEAPPGAEVRFFTGEQGADRGIIELVKEVEGNRMVVSSDREVREGVEAAGALALWSEAVVEWWKRR
jgi:hypothetical protein